MGLGVVAARTACRLCGARRQARPRDSIEGCRSASHHLLRPGSRAHLGPLGRGRRNGRAFSRCWPRLRAGPGSLRRGFALRAAVDRKDESGRGNARVLVADTGRPAGNSRAPAGGHRSDAAARPAGGAVARWARTCGPASTPTRSWRGPKGRRSSIERGCGRLRSSSRSPQSPRRSMRSCRAIRRRLSSSCSARSRSRCLSTSERPPRCMARMDRREISARSRWCSPDSRASEFAAERLTHQQQRLAGAGASDVTASVAIARLRRLVELHDWQHNMVFAPLAAAVLWGTHLALAVEAWRRVHGTRHSRVAADLRRVRSARLAVGLSLRAPRRSVSGDRRSRHAAGPASTAARSATRSSPPAGSSATTYASAKASSCSSSAGRTCRARARCFAPLE